MSRRKRFLITLSDQTELTLTEPKDLAAFLNAMPSLSALSKAFKSIDLADEGLTGMPPIPSSAIEGIYPILADMAGISVQEFEDLGVFDKMGILKGLSLFLPNGSAMPEPRLISPTSSPEGLESPIATSEPQPVSASG